MGARALRPDVIAAWLHPAEVWVGGNFLFGRDRSGNFSLLRSLGLRYGFRAEQIDPVRYRDFVVSSTRVRRLITEGRVDEAAALLGHYHFIDGTVVARAGRGRSIGFPTANLATENELLPPQGVYATAVTIGRGTLHRAITNIGVRPTFETRPRDDRNPRVRPRRRPLRPRAAALVRAAAARRADLSGRRRARRPDRRRLPEAQALFGRLSL